MSHHGHHVTVLTKITAPGAPQTTADAATAQDTVTLSDQDLVKLVQSLPRGSQERNLACEKLVNRYESLVRSCAQRYRHSP